MNSDASRCVRLRRVSDSVAGIVLDRPPVNVLRVAELEALAAAMGRVAPARAVVLSGNAAAFSAGVDVADHVPDAPRIEAMLAAMRAALRALVEVPAVTIASVRGACLGGAAELALVCDLVVVAEDARIGFPEIRLSCFPPAAAVLLPLVTGTARANDWILTGRVLSGREAFESGFAVRCFAGEHADREAERLAIEIASRSPSVLSTLLSLLRTARRRALDEDLPSAEDGYRRLAGDQQLARAVREFGSRREP